MNYIFMVADVLYIFQTNNTYRINESFFFTQPV